MAMDSVTIGPFTGGLNNISQAGEAKDTELIGLVNMNVTLDGAVTSRPPMYRVPSWSYAAGERKLEVLGIYRQTPSLWFLIIQIPIESGGWRVNAYALGDSSSRTEIKTSTTSARWSSFVQVGNAGYFCAEPGSGLKGFKWSPGTPSADIDKMPEGNVMVSFKSRLWITGSNKAADADTVWFSTIDASGIKIDTWNTAVDFYRVAPGEGGFITAMVALNSSLVIMKSDGTWRFSYATSPAKGNLDKVSGTIGAANKNVVAELNNLVYTYDQGRIYELVNNNYSAINRNIEFREDTQSRISAEGTDLSVVGPYLLLRYFDALYAYNSETGTWSQWRSTVGIPGKFTQLPVDSNRSASPRYFAPSVGLSYKPTGALIQNFFIQMEGDYSSTVPVEDIQCIIRTKSYDYKAPSVYKRLFWWGIDHKSYLDFTARAIPVVKKRIPTWGEMKLKTWGEAKALGTWGNPLKNETTSISVSDGFDVSNEQTENGRIFSKIKKSLRFRQISYEISMRTRGNAATGPVKIFTLQTHVSPKHHVIDKNN